MKYLFNFFVLSALRAGAPRPLPRLCPHLSLGAQEAPRETPHWGRGGIVPAAGQRVHARCVELCVGFLCFFFHSCVFFFYIMHFFFLMWNSFLLNIFRIVFFILCGTMRECTRAVWNYAWVHARCVELCVSTTRIVFFFILWNIFFFIFWFFFL